MRKKPKINKQVYLTSMFFETLFILLVRKNIVRLGYFKN